jgi:hypothetical protein
MYFKQNVSENNKVYYIKKELHELGVITAKTSFGNEIKVYDVERTICDILRSRERYSNNKRSTKEIR